MNEYRERMIGFLKNQPPVASLEAAPAKLEQMVRRLGESGMKRSLAPGKWTAQQIVSHLTDVEMVVGFRLRQALAEDNHTIQPIDQDAWARRYPGLDVETALRSFAALRAWNLAFIRGFSAEDYRRSTNHPERGMETVEVMVKMLAGHDLNHLDQLERIAAQAP
jgi:hypothetical protein